MNLTLIYHFQSSQNQDGVFQPASYKVIYFFSESGFIELSLMQELAKSVPDADHQNLNFLNLDDLKAFALRMSQEIDSPDIRLISVQDYNIGIDGAKDLVSFRSMLTKFGDLIMNQAPVKKKGFFNKIFN